jgi:hydroxymethylpyrimidine pyrophosphatase-like HAD family hydrolase
LLATRLDIPPENVVACGDSGNDNSLFGQGFRGVLVANAEQSVLDAAPEDTYRSALTHADGVLDGFLHWSKVSRNLGTTELPPQAANPHS